MEQHYLFASFGIKSLLARAFPQRARNASQSEIFQSRLASSNYGDDMIHMEGSLLSGLRQATVFAVVFSPMKNLTPNLRGDGHALSRARRFHAPRAGAGARAGRLNPPALLPRAAPRS